MKTHVKRVLASAVLAAIIGTPAAPAAASCQWAIVSSPNGGSLSNVLQSVRATSTDDIWAVGWYSARLPHHPLQHLTLIEHWSGSSFWAVIPSPNASNTNFLYSVTAISPSDAWAVGNYVTDGRIKVSKTLTEHWDGSAWTIVSSPNVGTNPSFLQSVSAHSHSDVWAVGYSNNGTSNTLAEHWNGFSWSIVPSPNGGPNSNQLTSVRTSPTDAWAVGGFGDSQNVGHTLTEHWDGSAWSIVPNPEPSTQGGLFEGVSSSGLSDVWAVGYATVGTTRAVLVEHWDGAAWSIASAPNPPSTGVGNILFATTTRSPTDAWAVGENFGLDGRYDTLTEHWNGSRWLIRPSADGHYFVNALYSVAEVPGMSFVWTVGTFDTAPSSGSTLAERCASP